MRKNIPTITVDCDTKCECGKEGVLENGLCMSCTAERMKQGGKGMSESLDTKTLVKAQKELTSLLLENWPDICRMRNLAAMNYSKSGNDGKFQYKVACGIVMVPKGDVIDVKVGISCSAPLKDETDFFPVDTQPDLGLDV